MGINEFNALIVNHKDILTPFAITLTKDAEEAKDLCQETLLKAFVYKDKYQQGTNVRAWLYTIMRNIFINGYRRNEKKREIFNSIAYLQKQAPMYSSAEGRLQLGEIKSSIDALPIVLKQVCLLYLKGYKYTEIAMAMNEPVGTIKSRIHFAKKMLQKQIDR